MKTKIILSLVLSLLAIFIIAEEVKKEENAPDFQLKNLKGKEIKLSEINKDKLVILDFWAIWCEPCKKELPHLNDFQKKYGDHIQVIAVSIDKARHASKAKAYINRSQI